MTDTKFIATANLSPTNLAELTAASGGTLQPGASWSLGNPFPEDLPVGCYLNGDSGIHWKINASGVITNQFELCVVPVPEPSTYLLGMGLLSLLAFTRHRKK